MNATTDALDRLEAYRRMLMIRSFEERSLELSTAGLVAGSIHPCLGQEAIPVGAMAGLDSHDRVLSTYRGHGWALASGVPMDALLGELCGREDGVNGGRGGSAHFFAPRWGMLGENSIVGAGVPIGAGVAVAARFRDERRVVVVSIGDGAMSQGSVHEGLVFATSQDLPLVVLIENNAWSEMTRTASLLRIKDLADRATAYGIPGHVVDGSDPIAVRDTIAEAAGAARSGGGPILIEAKTLRLHGHYNRDIEHYRSKDEREADLLNDPLHRLRQELEASGQHSQETLERLEADVGRMIEEATQTVRQMPPADPRTARDHLVAPDATADTTIPGPDTMPAKEMTYNAAVTAALRIELSERDNVLVYGEDVGHAGGIFGATRKLQKDFGPSRVFDTPISESAILGSAVGAAMAGLRPVVEIMWADFMLVALDQLINQAANLRYVSRGELTAPLVVRMQQGATPGSCAQHSQSLEALLAHIPGLKVGLPATPQDAYGMLRAAVADPDPVIVIEARALYQHKDVVDPRAVEDRVGGARVRRDGADLVILTWGTMLPHALTAADQLAAEGVEASVVDLRWLAPIDDETIDRVIRGSRGRVLVAHEANRTGGFGAEIAARVQERHFDQLERPVARVGLPDSRVPAAPALQAALVPDAETILGASRALCGTDRTEAAEQESMPR